MRSSPFLVTVIARATHPYPESEFSNIVTGYIMRVRCSYEPAGPTQTKHSILSTTRSVVYDPHTNNRQCCILNNDNECFLNIRNVYWDGAVGKFGGSFGSEWLELVGRHYMLNSHSSIHLAPTNPSSVCLDQSMSYMGIIGDSFSVWGESTFIWRDGRTTEYSSDITKQYLMDSEATVVEVSMNAMTHIANLIQQRFENIQSDNLFYPIRIESGCTHEVLDLLPSILIRLSDDRHTAIELVLKPEDYVKFDDSDRPFACSIALRGTSDENPQRLIGSPLLSKIVVHFDGINQRLGFCDPL